MVSAGATTPRLTPVAPATCPAKSSPHATIVPSLINAIACDAPAAIAITLAVAGLVNAVGTTFTFTAPVLVPHTTTVPSDFNAMEYWLLAAIAMTPVKPAGIVV